jgi:two-component system, cell cycle response regulator DivK
MGDSKTGALVTVVRRKIGAEGSRPLVMLVDDAQEARDMYSAHLVAAGFRVIEAVDGEHALLKAISLMPDVVVMDLAMPVLDGWEATHRLKTHPRTEHIAVIALTGRISRAECRRAEDAGADVVLMKPCAPEALLSVIERVFGPAKAAAQR